MNLENRIGDYQEVVTPCVEEGADMARHKLQIQMPNGNTEWFSGDSYSKIGQNIANRCFASSRPLKEAPFLPAYARKWYELTWKPKEASDKNTWKNVLGYIENHIVPYFDGVRIDEVKTSDVQTFLNQLIGQDKARSTVDKILIALRQIFDMAVEDELISKNPAVSKKLKKGDKAEEREPCTPMEVEAILTDLPKLKPEDRLFVLIPLYAGTRKGETLGLKWKDINWQEKTITVNRALHFRNGRPSEGAPKSAAGYRTIPLLPPLEAVLKPHAGNDEHYIVSGERMTTQSSFDRTWQRISKKINLHGKTSHSFRHTFATFMARHVDPKTLQYILGHSEISTTMDVYVHPQREHVITLSQTMGNIYSRR